MAKRRNPDFLLKNGMFFVVVIVVGVNPFKKATQFSPFMDTALKPGT